VDGEEGASGMEVGALTRYDERIDDNRVTWPFDVVF
jgi:hypothetical protein